MIKAFSCSWASLALRGAALLAYAVALMLLHQGNPELAARMIAPVLLANGLHALSTGLRLYPDSHGAGPSIVEGVLALASVIPALALPDPAGRTMIFYLATVSILNGAFQLASVYGPVHGTLPAGRSRLVAAMAFVPIGSGLVMALHPIVTAAPTPPTALAILAGGWGLYCLTLSVQWRRARRHALDVSFAVAPQDEAHASGHATTAAS